MHRSFPGELAKEMRTRVSPGLFFDGLVVLCRCLQGQLEGVGIRVIVMLFPSRTFETNRSPAR